MAGLKKMVIDIGVPKQAGSGKFIVVLFRLSKKISSDFRQFTLFHSQPIAAIRECVGLQPHLLADLSVIL